MRQKTIRLSTIIRKARDYLPVDYDYYSCSAVHHVVTYYTRVPLCSYDRIFKILKDYGCPTGSLAAFNEFTFGKNRQGARFLWLSFMIEETKNIKIKL